VEKQQALMITNVMDEWMRNPSGSYEIQKLQLIDKQLLNFHQWTKGKNVLAGYHVTRQDEGSYYFLFIDWHRNDNFYLVIYMQNKSTTVAEIQRTEIIKEVQHLSWTYNPLKRDGKNDIRKAYFKQVFGSLSIQVPVPLSTNDVELFFDHLFKLCHNRLRADRAVEIFNL
jgi:hypothetical protein